MLASRLRSRFVSAGLIVSALVAACGASDDDDDDDCETGTEDCRCSFSGRCDDGLVCEDERCVDEDGTGGTGGTGGSGGQGAGKGGTTSVGGTSGSAGTSTTGGNGASGGSLTAGSGGMSGSAGSSTAQGGEGGESGDGGEGAAAGEAPSGGRAGAGGRGGAGGRAGAGGKGGAGGRAGASGSAGNAGGAGAGSGGTGGSAPCTPITIGDLLAVRTNTNSTSATFESAVSPIGGAAPDVMTSAFFTGDGLDGHLTGSFTLGVDDEANYETCQRCILLWRDATTANERIFFATSGQLSIAEDSEPTLGRAAFTLTDVTLHEVTIDLETFESTLVPGGLCVQLASGAVSFTSEQWGCEPGYFGTGDGCDCGCTGSMSDPDCVNDNVSSCEYCHCPGDGEGCEPNSVDPEDTRQCLPTAPGG